MNLAVYVLFRACLGSVCISLPVGRSIVDILDTWKYSYLLEEKNMPRHLDT